MDNQLEYKEQMEKEIILDNMNHVKKYINSINDVTYNYKLFNESLYITHNEWLDNVKKIIKNAMNGSEININFSDIYYDSSLLSLLKKIAKPHDYRNNNENNINTNTNISESINNNEIFEKINELTDFNDIIGTINTCSKNKRKSLLSKIHNNGDDVEISQNENNNILNNINSNNEINNKENFEIEYNNIDDGDINMNEYNSNNGKTKFEINNQYNTNEKIDDNSLCTIEEQPSIEEKEKNSKNSQSSFNFFNSIQGSFNNKLNIQNNENNSNQNNFILDLNNNINANINSNQKINKFSPNTENKYNYKPIKNIETITTPEKSNNYPFSQTLNNHKNNYLISIEKNNNHNNTSNNQEHSPYFGQVKDSDYNSIKKDIQNNFQSLVIPQFSFKKNDENVINNNNFTFNISTEKKLHNNLPNTIKIESNNKKNVITIHTSKKKDHECPYSSNAKNNNNNNFINILTNSINKINNQNINNTNIKNKENNINIINNNNNESFNNNFVQNIVLSSLKKINPLNNKNKNIRIKEKYEDDFEEYEMSDSSNRMEDDDDDVEDKKFIPQWAMDEEYINQQIIKQNNNKDLITKSFGICIVEHLNLNMIFETHNEVFDIRNSTADWRDDDSLSKNKVTNIKDKEIDAMFPNRKLQF